MIKYSKYNRLYLLISSTFILMGLYFIFFKGFNFSIEFTGGAQVQYSVNKISFKQVEQVLSEQKIKADIRLEKNILDIQAQNLNQDQEIKLREALNKKLKTKVDLLQFESVGPSIGKETILKTLVAIFLAILGIMGYIIYAFKGYYFAIAAVVALFHDVLIILGAQAVMSYFWGASFDLMFVSALLTTMSFSVHDTIVIFDKIREYRSDLNKLNIVEQADKALNETMRRSIYNSVTAFIMLLALLIFGGDTIRFFVAALLVGVVTGTYSSPFVATPVYVWLRHKFIRK